MKKKGAAISAVMLVSLMLATAMSFTRDDPKKQKTDSTATTECKHHKEAHEAASSCEKKHDSGTCCKEAAESGENEPAPSKK